jgi:undecaprenyl diphosphate synthase
MHVGIIMDGNGRWAARRDLPRTAGHVAGARTVRGIVEAAARAGITTLTLYAFSADNWQRPHAEVNALMRLFRRYLRSETQNCRAESVRINVIGRRDRLESLLLETIEHSERLTADCRRMNLRIAVDYSSRQSILEAARACGASWIEMRDFQVLLDRATHVAVDTEELDLLIRTGGEQRLSDFLLWEAAYAELYFSERLWPDFSVTDFQQALAEFGRRERRFGNIPALRVPA